MTLLLTGVVAISAIILLTTTVYYYISVACPHRLSVVAPPSRRIIMILFCQVRSSAPPVKAPRQSPTSYLSFKCAWTSSFGPITCSHFIFHIFHNSLTITLDYSQCRYLMWESQRTAISRLAIDLLLTIELGLLDLGRRLTVIGFNLPDDWLNRDDHWIDWITSIVD